MAVPKLFLLYKQSHYHVLTKRWPFSVFRMLCILSFVIYILKPLNFTSEPPTSWNKESLLRIFDLWFWNKKRKYCLVDSFGSFKAHSWRFEKLETISKSELRNFFLSQNSQKINQSSYVHIRKENPHNFLFYFSLADHNIGNSPHLFMYPMLWHKKYQT